ncbi:MAG: iron ABC transporter permease [Spirochaetales bacterium]|nr:iron ABC transporter permease [Spirochaetales bacterium]
MHQRWWFVILGFILLFVCVLAVQLGSYFINFHQVMISIGNWLTHKQFSNTDKIIISIRVPRILLSLIAGGILAVSGVVYQTMLRNSLAEPFTLGVSSGATFGVALSLLISATVGMILPKMPFAFFGGFVTILLLAGLIFYRDCSLYTLIFIGISISYFFNALLTLVMSLLGDKSYEILLWMFGTFSNPPKMASFIGYSVVCIAVIAILLVFHRTLDLFYLPDETIATSGIKPGQARIFFLCVVSVATIYTVSICGVIGFVGLIVPHIAGMIFGKHHRSLIAASCLLGAILMVCSDTFARCLPMIIKNCGRELPVGVVTSLLGVPCFVLILMKRGRMS